MVRLTPREADVASVLRFGKANKAIAYQLGMQETTVKGHLVSIYRKLGATNRVEAVLKLFQMETNQ